MGNALPAARVAYTTSRTLYPLLILLYHEFRKFSSICCISIYRTSYSKEELMELYNSSRK